MRYPHFLPENGTIGFIAPSFGCSTEPYKSAFDNAQKKFAEKGYRCVCGPNAYKGTGIGISAAPRECAEELAISIKVGTQFMEVVHNYPDMLIRLTLFHCTIPEGFPQALEHNDIRWIHPSEIDDYAFCPADTDILKEIKRVYEKRKPL